MNQLEDQWKINGIVSFSEIAGDWVMGKNEGSDIMSIAVLSGVINNIPGHCHNTALVILLVIQHKSNEIFH